MQTDPFEARRTGAHRLRVVTASIGAAAVVGTGALAWSLVADSTSASADQSSTSTTNDTSTSGNTFSQSSTLPQSSSSSSVHASSGGS
jgi:hypothetical protein